MAFGCFTWKFFINICIYLTNRLSNTEFECSLFYIKDYLDKSYDEKKLKK